MDSVGLRFGAHLARDDGGGERFASEMDGESEFGVGGELEERGVEVRKWGLWDEVVCLEDCIGCAGWDVGFLGERSEFRIGLHLGGEVRAEGALFVQVMF